MMPPSENTFGKRYKEGEKGKRRKGETGKNPAASGWEIAYDEPRMSSKKNSPEAILYLTTLLANKCDFRNILII